jgi:hypothetical protein
VRESGHRDEAAEDVGVCYTGVVAGEIYSVEKSPTHQHNATGPDDHKHFWCHHPVRLARAGFPGDPPHNDPFREHGEKDEQPTIHPACRLRDVGKGVRGRKSKLKQMQK